MPDLSIIIINWNTRDLLVRCLHAIEQTAGELDLEIIVVDNASSDDSVPVLRRQFPSVHLVANSSNVGFARANNQALRMARGRYYLLLNSDAFVHAGAVRTMLEYMEQHPKVGGVGCQLVYEDGTLQRSCSSFPTLATELWQALWLDRLFPKSPVFGRYLMSYWDMNDMREVDCVLGACLMLRREAIAQVGLFDERFFMYSEEVDLCYRLKRAGWAIYFVPSASATHIWGGSANKVPAQTFLRLYNSRLYFFRKHYGPMTAALYRLVLLGSSALRVAVGSFVSLFKKDPQTRQSVQNYWALVRALPGW